jgi:death on curing protein
VSSVIYLTADEVWAINEQILHGSGGMANLRDRGVLESAVVRPQMRAFYENADLVDQAATLIIGLALAHAIVDGNKRTAAIAGDTFLRLNGRFIVPEGVAFGEELLLVVSAKEDRALAERRFNEWLRDHIKSLRCWYQVVAA